jgi:hypothetical protein
LPLPLAETARDVTLAMAVHALLIGMSRIGAASGAEVAELLPVALALRAGDRADALALRAGQRFAALAGGARFAGGENDGLVGQGDPDIVEPPTFCRLFFKFCYGFRYPSVAGLEFLLEPVKLRLHRSAAIHAPCVGAARSASIARAFALEQRQKSHHAFKRVSFFFDRIKLDVFSRKPIAFGKLSQPLKRALSERGGWSRISHSLIIVKKT